RQGVADAQGRLDTLHLRSKQLRAILRRRRDMMLTANNRPVEMDAARFVLQEGTGNAQLKIAAAKSGKRSRPLAQILGQERALASRLQRIEKPCLFQAFAIFGKAPPN